MYDPGIYEPEFTDDDPTEEVPMTWLEDLKEQS